ncbi:uncharacterized protein LOC120489212 [Pimephales promelas]|uniref:uncharacterized protein LOC120489212 n=1 Tax=Pimephales promelas TaxID=90988 RepID=UPI0019558B2E|nr:uncharacterized protein LOC120489212 [Pimephales promelas]
MKSVLPVKMLAALALVLLVSSATEGRILSKCELKAQLEAALGGNQGESGPGNVTPGIESVTGDVVGNGTAPGNATVDLDLIAKIVCSAERLSKFNTNLVNAIGSPADSRPRPGQRPNGRPVGRPGQGRPGGRGKRSPGGGRDRNPPSIFGDSSEEDSSETLGVTTKLFGIFQLNDRVACDSGSGQSLNICQINCSALIDDDIRDDITCLKTLLDSVTNAAAPVFAPRPKKKKHMLCVKECRNVNPLQYFAVCV